MPGFHALLTDRVTHPHPGLRSSAVPSSEKGEPPPSLFACLTLRSANGMLPAEVQVEARKALVYFDALFSLMPCPRELSRANRLVPGQGRETKPNDPGQAPA